MVSLKNKLRTDSKVLNSTDHSVQNTHTQYTILLVALLLMQNDANKNLDYEVLDPV